MAHKVTNRQFAAYLVDRLYKDGIIPQRLVKEGLKAIEEEIKKFKFDED